MSNLFQELFDSVFGVWASRYAFSANFAIQLYNYFTTLDQENYFYEKVSGVSPTSVLFVVNRYLPFANAFVDAYGFMMADSSWNHCLKMFAASTYLVAVQFIIAESVLFYRASVVWMNNKYANCIASAILMASSGLGLYSAYEYSRTATTYHANFKSPGCMVDESGSLTRALIIVTASETTSLALLISGTLWTARGQPDSQDNAPIHGLLKVMLKDGIVYFVCIILICAANTITNVLSDIGVNKVFHTALIPLQATLQNILCIRLLLHVRLVNDIQTGEHEHELSMLVASGPQSGKRKFGANNAPDTSGSGSIEFNPPPAANIPSSYDDGVQSLA